MKGKKKRGKKRREGGEAQGKEGAHVSLGWWRGVFGGRGT